jgi:serine/threonine protein kinase
MYEIAHNTPLREGRAHHPQQKKNSQDARCDKSIARRGIGALLKFHRAQLLCSKAMVSEKEIVSPTKVNDKGPTSITRIPCDIHGKHTFNVAGQHFCVSTRYQVMTVIGVGAYGTVVAAIDRETKHRVAIKRVGSLFEDIVDAKRILREIRLMRFLQHSNVRPGRAASGALLTAERGPLYCQTVVQIN